MKIKFDKNKIYKIVKAILIICVILYIIWKFYEYDNDKKTVLKNFEITTGRIVSYSIKGEYHNRTLTYIYKADNENYTRTMTPNVEFDSCYAENVFKCTNLKFIVIYSKNFPEKSLIDLSRQVQDMGILILPKTIKNFK